MRKAVLLLAGVAAIACASVAPGAESADPVFFRDDPAVRIALGSSRTPIVLTGSGEWRIYDRTRDSFLTTGKAGEGVSIQLESGQMRTMRAGGNGSTRRTGPFLVRSLSTDGTLTFNKKRYRGELWISVTDTGMLVVNRLPMESYLRGVVPLEIGKRPRSEIAAVEAQAVAARSYSYSHIGVTSRPFDMYATVQDQVYGGVDAETEITDEAIHSTAGMVLKFAGRVLANTPYSSTCGGSTAATSEVWYKEPDQPFLQPVSDRIPGTDKFYCDPSPRFSWTETFTGDQLNAVINKYLASYTNAPAGDLGRVRMVRETGRTQTDRVRALEITTDRGTYTLRGNDTRFVLRNPAGAILNSTYFTTELSTGSTGAVQQLTVKGRGYGHGIGMCQWGAIGRARAGQDYKTILTTYYRGTSVEKF
ncbi:MAG: SpoIID/LytB domain-containing protein [Gemmatimonadaceae bacterium]|nr:SpoIID/LytB domain-containing protein [Gemmatimonadaceae bacterium]